MAPSKNDIEYEDEGAEKKYKRRKKKKQYTKQMYWSAALVILVLLLLIRNKYNSRRMPENNKLSRFSNVKHLMAHILESKMKLKRPKKNADRKKTEAKPPKNDHVPLDSGENRRWADPRHLPAIPTRVNDVDRAEEALRAGMKNRKNLRHNRSDFRVKDDNGSFPWEEEGDDEITGDHVGPKVDYTKIEVKHPKIIRRPPENGGYPPTEPLRDIFERWPQDEFDDPPLPHIEKLLHFDYMDLAQRKAAARFRDAELPFKVYNVPELHEASVKWTDEYLAGNFDSKGDYKGFHAARGHCQESEDNYFAFFKDKNWNIDTMGPPPTMDNKFNFAKWSKHARYADKVGLPPSEKHFYWQSGAPQSERTRSKYFWTFISRDLPSFSSTTANFFQFKPEYQKGIQCRFGERGVIAATHYDGGRNMVGMITGAKRYILSPPKACGNLGIISSPEHPAFRHSLLNYGHMNMLKDPDALKEMPSAAREWLELAQKAPSIDTILRAGEVLYIPSGWFHYIVSLQKSAQCNTRSGADKIGTKEFGSMEEHAKCALKE